MVPWKVLLPERTAATQGSEVSKARQVSTEAGGRFMALWLSSWGRRGKHSWPHGVAATQGGPFITPFPSLSVKVRMLHHQCRVALPLSAAGLCHITAAQCISLGCVLLDEGSPFTTGFE